MKRIVFYIVFISLSVSNVVFSQSTLKTYDLAKQAYQSGNNSLALKYFDRVAFFSDDSLKYASYAYLGDIYVENQEYSKAVNNYSFAQAGENNTDKWNELQLKIVKVYTAMKSYNLAYAAALELPDNKKLNSDKELYLAYNLYQLNRFKESKSHYLSIIPKESHIQLIKYFNRAAEVEDRSVKFYKIISYVIPGLGQALNGYYLDALNSLILNGALIGLFVYTTGTIGLIEGGVAVVPWLYRYYSGGADNAEKWATERKSIQLQEIHHKILELAE